MIKTKEKDAPIQEPDPPSNGSNGGKRRPKPLHLAILAVVVVAGGYFGYGKWQFITTHAGTDNAYVTADISQIAPEVSAMVEQVLVADNQHVKKGDLLVVMDDSKYKTAVAQAKGNLDAAIADARTAGVNVDVTKLTGTAMELQAEGMLDQSVGGFKGAEDDAVRAAASVRAALAAQRTARADAQSAVTDVAMSKLALQRAELAVSGAQTQLDGAKAALSSAQSTADSTRARLAYATKEAARMKDLVASGAVSQQRYDNADTELQAAQAQFQASQGQVAAAKAAVTGRQIDLSSAKTQVEMARSSVAEAQLRSQAAGGRHSGAVAQSEVGRAQQASAQEMIAQAAAKKKQAEGQLKQAETTPQQVSAREAMHQQALAKVEQARAALAAAELDLRRTRIVAPISGVVSNKTAEPGMLLQAGTPMLSIVADANVYVVANFKETQIERMRTGQTVDISIDGFDAHDFAGKVDSIAAGTGSTFALLPADNATGNFVKVVQRVPVKIVLDPGQKDLDALRAGMSVYVAVKLR